MKKTRRFDQSCAERPFGARRSWQAADGRTPFRIRQAPAERTHLVLKSREEPALLTSVMPPLELGQRIGFMDKPNTIVPRV